MRPPSTSCPPARERGHVDPASAAAGLPARAREPRCDQRPAVADVRRLADLSPRNQDAKRQRLAPAARPAAAPGPRRRDGRTSSRAPSTAAGAAFGHRQLLREVSRRRSQKPVSERSAVVVRGTWASEPAGPGSSRRETNRTCGGPGRRSPVNGSRRSARGPAGGRKQAPAIPVGDRCESPRQPGYRRRHDRVDEAQAGPARPAASRASRPRPWSTPATGTERARRPSPATSASGPTSPAAPLRRAPVRGHRPTRPRARGRRLLQAAVAARSAASTSARSSRRPARPRRSPASLLALPNRHGRRTTPITAKVAGRPTVPSDLTLPADGTVRVPGGGHAPRTRPRSAARRSDRGPRQPLPRAAPRARNLLARGAADAARRCCASCRRRGSRLAPRSRPRRSCR